MSTAGKTMVQKSLAGILDKNRIKYRIVSQTEGLPPDTFQHYDPKKSVEFLHSFLDGIKRDHDKVIICDRLHISHIAITNADEHLADIEKQIRSHDPIIILLTVNEKIIDDRLQGAIKHRGQRWVDEMERKGDRTESTSWFTNTQKRLLGLYGASELPKIMIDSSNSNFDGIADDIYEKFIRKRESEFREEA